MRGIAPAGARLRGGEQQDYAFPLHDHLPGQGPCPSQGDLRCQLGHRTPIRREGGPKSAATLKEHLWQQKRSSSDPSR